MKYIRLFIYTCVVVSVMACHKEFLDKKPNSAIKQPSTLEDFQALLDHYDLLGASLPCLPLLASDDYYFTSKSAWQSAETATARSSYLWEPDVYGGEMDISDWNGPFAGIFYVNNILNRLEEINVGEGDRQAFNEIKGQALFFRAYTYFELVKNFSPAYDAATAYEDLGIPLRLRGDIDYLQPRASLQECYDQIHLDLNEAMRLLTLQVPNQSRNRASKLAAYAFAARLYLSKREYSKAEAYADTTLTFYSKLIDYNEVDTTSSSPFTVSNDETILTTLLAVYGEAQYNRTTGIISVDSTLLKSYDENDLRFPVFFRQDVTGSGYRVKRGYNGDGLNPFNGLAVDEIYLIKAECAARAGETPEAMETLNALLLKRYRSGTFVPLIAANEHEALEIVLNERRKELVWRGLRWDDLKRLNKDGANITLTRNLDGEIYTLPPNDPRYVFNIPADEIALSGIEQNIR